MIEVVRPGALTTVQDLGRSGYAHLGVPRSGALDVPALTAANQLVGNDTRAAGLETTIVGCVLRVTGETIMAVTGAYARVSLDGVDVPHGVAVPVPAGSLVRIGPARTGVRSYVAFAGGLAVPPVLGSRSTDTLSGLGPAPLRAGDQLPLGSPPATAPANPPYPPPATAPATPPRLPGAQPQPARPTIPITLRVRLGPRQDWFTDSAIEALLGMAYQVSTQANRIGARLVGPLLPRALAGELPSEGLVLGAVQVPADGQPLIFLADHPTTGGYPVIAVVEPDGLPVVAQARPGATVRFRGPEL